MNMKVLDRTTGFSSTCKWILMTVAIGFQCHVSAADDDNEKKPVGDTVKEQIVDDAQEKEDAGKVEVGEASYNAQDCEPADDDADADKKNMKDAKKEDGEKDKNDEAENDEAEEDSSESTDDLDECRKVVK